MPKTDNNRDLAQTASPAAARALCGRCRREFAASDLAVIDGWAVPLIELVFRVFVADSRQNTDAPNCPRCRRWLNFVCAFAVLCFCVPCVIAGVSWLVEKLKG